MGWLQDSALDFEFSVLERHMARPSQYYLLNFTNFTHIYWAATLCHMHMRSCRYWGQSGSPSSQGHDNLLRMAGRYFHCCAKCHDASPWDKDMRYTDSPRRKTGQVSWNRQWEARFSRPHSESWEGEGCRVGRPLSLDCESLRTSASRVDSHFSLALNHLAPTPTAFWKTILGSLQV
jgi:hypothetical protein